VHSQVLSVVLRVAAYVCRICAWILFVLVGILAFGSILGRTHVLEFAMDVTDILPSAISGAFVWPTPFDGAFRGDFAIASIILFILDWLFMRISQAVR
jgi:hypothetical protein